MLKFFGLMTIKAHEAAIAEHEETHRLNAESISELSGEAAVHRFTDKYNNTVIEAQRRELNVWCDHGILRDPVTKRIMKAPEAAEFMAKQLAAE